MLKKALMLAPIAIGFAFAAGVFVGWKTTLRIMDDVIARREKSERTRA